MSLKKGLLGIAFAATILIFGPALRTASGQESSPILTPKPPDAPRIHGPKVYGVRAGHPFVYRIPCTGIRPIQFAAKHLPASLKLDSHSGIITGETPQTRGTYAVEFTARSAYGKDSRTFKIVVGDAIGLTPQMGWNDWYTFYSHITDADVRKAAAAMVSSGMADFGYQFVDIDDAWARKPGSTNPDLSGPVRDAEGNILPSARFPNMPALTAYIHSLGLKAGIYTSPGPLTCAKFEGSYQHENADAHRFAQWGFDLLKYDYCSYGRVAKDRTLPSLEAPYIKMGAILKDLNRDVVLNMCQYGMGDVWKWGKEVGGNSWRTTGDLGSVPNRELPGFYSVGFRNAALSQYAGPGGWNDPDYILIGTIGDAHGKHHTTLTPNEQYSYMSMWSLMASPLFFSGDMTALDPFTKNVLCNSEVIDIDQDSLGKQGTIVRKTDSEFILAKPLDDGSLAVGLFNLTLQPRTISVNWADLGIHGKRKVRDVWRQRDLGAFNTAYSSPVPAHGVMLIRLIRR